MVVGVVMDGDGNPVCCELWPGNSTDVNALLPVQERLQNRFEIDRACLVADREMGSAKTLSEFEDRNVPYILGMRMNATKVIRQEVPTRAARYQKVYPARSTSKEPSPLT